MGVLVDLQDVIRARIAAAMGAGKVLADFKRLVVGYRLEARGFRNTPTINLSLVSGNIENVYQKGGTTDNPTYQIKMVMNKLTGANKQYNKTGSKGAIFYLEALLDTIENNTSGVLDFDMDGTASGLREYSYDIDESNDVMEININYTLETIQFYAGNRQ